MIKVFIVDDHKNVREGIKKILNEAIDMTVVGEADNGDDVLNGISEVECDILLLDLNIPGRKGPDLIEEIKKMKPNLQILILSISPENIYALPLISAGASGYVSKDSVLNELVNAIHKVSAKERYLSDNLTKQLVADILWDKM
jgi:DNA-binding NarL/FixJ family response regulator